ncbi:MAG: hypothetical protein CME88_14220 [Hirschia sp.]|nr:hypothetical protein [Hirschia sp.]MBF19529.1 hypothetical protein [Hirschia sp.]
MGNWDPQSASGTSSDDMRAAVDTHLASHIGDHETAFCDEEGWAGHSREDGPPIDVLVVPPEGERLFAYVATFGCAFRPLPSEAYHDEGVERRVEFVLAAQQVGKEDPDLHSLNLAANTVRQFAKLVHLNGVTVEPGETVAFSDDPKPVYDDADFCAFAFIPPRLPGPGFEWLMPSNTALGEPVRYIAPIPIHKAELEYGVELGGEALVKLLMDAGATEMIDLKRPCAVSARPDLQMALESKQAELAEKDKSGKPEAELEEFTAVGKAALVSGNEKRGLFSWILSLVGIR